MNNEVTLLKPLHTTLTESCVQTLKQAIEDGSFVRGSQLPPEMDLINRMGVSRTTIREALRILESQGLIIRRRGLGTFVSIAPILKDMSSNYGITEMISQSGYVPKVENTVVSSGTISSYFASLFSIPKGEPITIIDRLRSIDNEPVVWSIDIVPASILPENAFRPLEATAPSIYTFLLEEYNIRIIRGIAHLYPIAATGEMSVKLNVPKSSPLMRITQTDYDVDNRPVLYSIEYHIPNAFDFVVNRMGPSK
jgi:GntR family transcriptional regulator